jgi:hypothetical protein
MTALTTNLSAFARPSNLSMLLIKKSDAYQTFVPMFDENNELLIPGIAEDGSYVNVGCFESLAGIRIDGQTFAVDAAMIQSITGRAMMAPLYAPKSDSHTYGFAAKGLSSADDRIESAVYRESARQNRDIEQLKAQGIEAKADTNAIINAAAKAQDALGGANYGLIFETPITLYPYYTLVNGEFEFHEPETANVFISLKSLLQTMYFVFGQDYVFVHDNSLRHVSNPLPLREVTADILGNEGLAGAFFLGYPVKADGTPHTTSKLISDDWASWQLLAETLSIIVTTVGGDNRTTAVSYIRPATLVAMVFGESVEVVANPVPVITRQAQSMANRVAAPATFAKPKF